MPNTARNRDKYMATGVEEPQNNAISMEIDSITWARSSASCYITSN